MKRDKEETARRRQWVKRFMHSFADSRHWRNNTADIFSCSHSTIYSDIYILQVQEKYGNIRLYPTLAQRIYTKTRDKLTCQYCGIINPKNWALDHIICCLRGGVTEPYNMAFSCTSCNNKKGDFIWLPKNIQQLALENKEWAEKIEYLSRRESTKYIFPRIIK